MYYKYKTNKIMFRVREEIINIPSRMYPLESPGCTLFTPSTTVPIEDDRIEEIFDSLEFEMGRCFTNSEKLCKALNDVGYKAEQYVGWVFMQDELPVHHSFVVLGNSIIDPTVSLLCKDIEQLERLNPGSDHETRINLMNLYKEKQFLPNHIKCIFGKVDDLYVYVGAPGTAEEGIKRNVLLRKEYPDHPCFQDVSNGTTAMQRMIMNQ